MRFFAIIFGLFLLGSVYGVQESFAEHTETTILCSINDISSRNATCTAEIKSNNSDNGYIGILGPSCSDGLSENNIRGERLFIGPRYFDPSISQAGCYRAWITWDLSEIPKDSKVLDSIFKFKKLSPSNSMHQGNVHAMIYSLENNPSSINASKIRNDIRDGVLYVGDSSQFTKDGSYLVNLGTNASDNLTKHLSSNEKWFGVGISASNENTSRWNMVEIDKEVTLLLTFKPSSQYIKDNILNQKQTILFEENFDEGLKNWSYQSFSNSSVDPVDNYNATIISKNSESYVLIEGDGFAITVGIQKEIDIPENTNDTFLLSFKSNATSNGFSSSFPNIRVDLKNSDDKNIHGEYVLFGGPIENNWKWYQLDITKYIQNENQIKIFLGLGDMWISNLNQKVAFDDIKITIVQGTHTIDSQQTQINEEDKTNQILELKEENKQLQSKIEQLKIEKVESNLQIDRLIKRVDMMQQIIIEQIKVIMETLADMGK